MRDPRVSVVALAVAVALSVLAGCGKSNSNSGSSPTFAVKGYATAPQASFADLVRYDRLMSTVGCDGGLPNVCCAPGTGCDPSMMDVTVYKVWLSPNANCTAGTLVTDNSASATPEDVTQDPTLITGSPSAGTYNCVVMEISDTMQFKANQTAVTDLGGACNSTTATYTFDVFRDGDTWWNYDTASSEAGQGEKGAPVAQKVTIYVSTNTAAITDPVDPGQVMTLSKAVTVVSGSETSLGMVIDFSDQIENQNGADCWMAGANISFVNL